MAEIRPFVSIDHREGRQQRLLPSLMMFITERKLRRKWSGIRSLSLA